MKKIIFIFFLICSALLTGCSLVRILNYDITKQININRSDQEEAVLRRKIDGQEISKPELANLFPVAIMVENSADAWPLSGLNKANLVFEAITEASIPRLVAFYANDEEIEKIGPVRSARPYYLDWAEPYQPLYLHVGGSAESLGKIKSAYYKLIDLDQFFNWQYFWRDKWRYAPHNVYTSSELIKQALEDKNLNQPADFETWQYKKDLELDKRPQQVNDIKINFAAQYYKVRWVYNREENNYIRYQNGDIHKMSDGEWIKAKNIIAQVNKMQILDEVGRKKFDTLGEGNAYIYRDGEKIEGKWVKESLEKMMKYFDNNGNEIKFNGGATWIEVMPNIDYLRD
ncbi:MAG: hypothetical protein A2Y67_03105 [Candidatus Buchananbacteria bacterium RBG_13_39_9]|uniref:DUF3048 domain-containing protein n=1 Tax=Candidatus Buchananbacteria bacterium RBG_13_39_9 TaxID=1797531 RepID=A0A1G1XQ41_9BACT|nr:MAG: hypothetical protein A2Y67_03105 [Candidatus Buchananbacteria bacterium RBG_13_39_9]